MIIVVGLSHKTAPLEVREKLTGGVEMLPQVLARLGERDELQEAVFLSTCNRVDVFACTKGESDAGFQAIREVLKEGFGITRFQDLAPYIYERSGPEAVRHIFRVASSLDSMVIGEPQILGQVKEAFEAATAAGTIGAFLGRCMTRAFRVAKRVRTDTSIGEGSVSVSSVAVDLARHIFGDLSKHVVLLLGAGEMAETAARSLSRGALSVHVCNRSFDRAQALATEIEGTAVSWDALETELVRTDIVVASTGSRDFVVTHEMVKRAMKSRRGRTLFFVDIAVPRNVEPSVHTIDNVYVFNVDDLEQQVAEGQKTRQSELESAESIVLEELQEFEAWSRGLNAQPAIVALRAHTRAVLLGELERAFGGRLKHLGEGDRAALTQLIDSAANKLLHAPTTHLKEKAGGEEGADWVRVVRYLFELPDVPTPSLDDRGRSPLEEYSTTPPPSGDGEPRLPN